MSLFFVLLFERCSPTKAVLGPSQQSENDPVLNRFILDLPKEATFSSPNIVHFPRTGQIGKNRPSFAKKDAYWLRLKALKISRDAPQIPGVWTLGQSQNHLNAA